VRARAHVCVCGIMTQKTCTSGAKEVTGKGFEPMKSSAVSKPLYVGVGAAPK